MVMSNCSKECGGNLRGKLAKVRGLGSAKDGTAHWVAQRVTAIALVPLIVWFVTQLVFILSEADKGEILAWFAHPFNAIMMLLLLCTGMYHARLGIQVVIEDYIHCHVGKPTLLLLNKFIFTVASVVALFAIIKLHFSG
jgi:succinate dehydrogenase / fumarate reductase, membrane anchor subunit